jgi:putative aldouronate transport system substrate-binding protein
MRKMIEKRLAVLLLLLAILVVSGCSGGTQSQGGKESAPSKSDKPITIKWLSFNPPDADGNTVQTFLEKKYNVKIENMRIDRANWQEQLNVKLAGEDIPDIWFLWNTTDISIYSQQGLLAELPVQEIKQNMPKYSKTVDDLNPNLWKYGSVKGKEYTIPLYWELGASPFLPIYNTKWLKAIGYNEAPKTLEELEDVFTKFRNNDPDGNGKKDTYGLSGDMKQNMGSSFNVIFGAYGTKWNTWIKDKDGKLVNTITTEPLKQAMITLNRWYKSGLIDPEFITNDRDKFRQSFYNGRIGELETDWINIHHTGIINQGFKKLNAANEYIIGKPVKGPYGEGNTHSSGIVNSYVGMGINAAKDPAKKKKVYEILEGLATDKETYLMSVHGEEGKHYEMKDGVAIMKDEYLLEAKRGSFGGGTYYGIFGNTKSSLMKDLVLTKERQAFAQKVSEGVKTLVDEKRFSVAAEIEYPDLNKFLQENYIKFITGEYDPNTGFDKFIDGWKKAGGAKITEQVNEQYKEIMK